MSYPVDSLEPKAVWTFFDLIRQIPHGSGNEKALGEAVVSWAKERGCDSSTDDLGNVVVRVPATPGCENAPTLVMQGHLDMVCEKNNDTVFDFEKDAIEFVRDGEWLTANGTTLGADNGIGVAAALAFTELKDVKHGPLELLFTIDEERGLNGARGLSTDFLKGRMMFNLDSEEDGVFYIGCAGGRDTDLELPLTFESTPSGLTGVNVTLKGLRGGHSGMDIALNRGNAIRLLARALNKAGDLRLVSIEGGDKHNAIPRESVAVIACSKDALPELEKNLRQSVSEFATEFASAEPDLSISIEATDMPKSVMTQESAHKALALIMAVPHGVLALARDLPGAVETSNNMARVRTEDNKLTFLTSSRSSVASALDGVIDQLESTGKLAGANVNVHPGYPGWQPNPESAMLATAKKVWKETHGEDAKFEVIHAGLECGLIGEKFPGMDMISLGPTIEGPHSPEEKLHIGSVGRFFQFVRAFVESVASM